MRTIKDKELHEKYCNICIDSPNSLLQVLTKVAKALFAKPAFAKCTGKET